MKFGILTVILVMTGGAVLCGSSVVRGHPGQVLTTIQHTEAEDPSANGFWQRQVSWKPRWVKHWQQKALYIPLWKKVWGPIVHNEWVPIPKPPPDWHYPHAEKEASIHRPNW